MVMTWGNDRRFLSNCVMCWISFRLTLTPVAPSLPGGPSDPGVPWDTGYIFLTPHGFRVEVLFPDYIANIKL